MMGWMYILECSDGTYYTGSTIDLEKRLWEHDNFLGAKYTKKKHPVKLVYCEEYNRIDEAFRREKQVQGWSHAKKKALIAGEWHKVSSLAKKIFLKRRGEGHLDTPPMAALGDRVVTDPTAALGDRTIGDRTDGCIVVCSEAKKPVVECSERSEERIETSGTAQHKVKE